LAGDVVGDKLAPEFGESSFFNRVAGFFHCFHEHAGVVDAEHSKAKDFADVKKVAEVGAGKVLAREAIAAFLDRAEVGLICAGLDTDAAFAGEGGAVAGDASGQDAIEHVDAARDEFDHLGGGAEAHRVARLVCRKMGFGDLDGAKHFGFGFADADATNGVAVEVERNESLGALFAQIWIDAALDNSEDHLAGRARLFTAFSGPAHRAFDSGAKFARGAGVGRAIVENHRDVGAEFTLNLHGFFRAEKKKRAIEVRTEFDPVGFDFANGREAEDLEAAAVGKDRERPIDELVEAVGGADDVHPRTDVEMIGVTEDNLSA